MSDDLTKRGPADRHKVSLAEEHEVRYWCKEFGCTPEQLKAAVLSKGHSVVVLRQHFGK